MELTFEDFKQRANNPNLSKWEKIGFPDSYRKDADIHIFYDIIEKLQLNYRQQKILDVGCGCSRLVELFIEHAKNKDSELHLVDSKEMLKNINNSIISDKIQLHQGYFPKIDSLNVAFNTYFDGILVYSVIQYVFLEQSIFSFIHKCIDLLKPGGRLLLGDIPNISCRDRFLSSREGETFKNNVIQLNNAVSFDHEKTERIDDSVVFSIMSRFRNFGCETYLLPQPKELPFGNRREDILIIKR